MNLEQIASWIDRQQKSGHQKEQIVNYLLQNNISQNEISQAYSMLNTKPIQNQYSNEPQNEDKTKKKILIILIVITILIFVMIMFNFYKQTTQNTPETTSDILNDGEFFDNSKNLKTTITTNNKIANLHSSLSVPQPLYII